MKKTIALLLAVLMCLALFAACQSSELSAYTASPTDTDAEATDNAAAADTATTPDYTPCFESYKPDAVMMTVNGIDVTWRELFYWYYYDVSSIQHYYGDITDWDDTSLFNGEKSVREYITNNGLETVKHYAALESKAKELGIALDDEDKATIEQRWQDNIKNYGNGDEQEFIDYLKTLFLDKELYNHINEISALYTKLLTETYGENGSKLTDEDILSGAAELGYNRAKHIFLSLTDADGNALTDEQKAAKKAQLQTILDELKKITDPAKLEAKIDEYTASVSEDTGKDYYTDGYTFLPGEFNNEAFETGVTSVGENELNPEIVESSLGYHIIMHLPLSTTAKVAFSSETEYTTLKDIVPDGMFEAQVDDWAQDATVEYSKAYNKMDVAKVFSKVKTGDAADSSEGVAWYIIVIIVLLVALVAVGVILVVQRGKNASGVEPAQSLEAEPRDETDTPEQETDEAPEGEQQEAEGEEKAPEAESEDKPEE